MALKGTLKDFSVADIFQLIGQQGKSGSLYVRTKDKEAHIVFDNGKVVLGTFKKSDEDFLLGTMLLRAGVITSDHLTRAIESQKTTMRSLGDILKSEGLITSATLSEFVALQLKEVLFRLFQWSDGLYEFVAEKIQYNKSIIKPQTAESVLMDGFRMLDEWPLISEKVGSLEGVFMSKASPLDLEATAANDGFDMDLDAAFSDGPESDAPKPDVPKKREITASGFSPEEKKVLSFLDGKKSLQEVVYLTRLGTFDTVKCVCALLDRNAVEKVNELLPTRVDFSKQHLAAESLVTWLARSYRALLALFVLSVSVPIVAFGIRSHWSDRYQQGATTSITFEQLKEIQERESLVQLLDLYRLQTNSYPNMLEELQKPSLTANWDYAKNGEFYVLNRRVTNK